MRRRAEDGFTIVELVVTVLLVSVVGALFYGFLDNTTSLTARASRNVDAEKEGQIAMRTISEALRGANPIVTTYPGGATSCPAGGTYPAAYGTCLRFLVVRSDLAGPICTGPGGLVTQAPYSVVTFARVGSEVRQDVTDVSATCVVERTTVGRVVMSGVVNPTSKPVFTMLDRSGVATTQPANASTVRIATDVQYQTNSPVLSLSSTVALRNYR